MSSGIVGITRTSLWSAWKAIRRELKHASIRDVADFLEYDIDPDVWINRMLRQISNGAYEPATPRRFPLAKTKGFSRRMAMPTIPDLVLYRAIADYLYYRARRQERKHVYFERGKLAQEQDVAAKEAAEPKKLGDPVLDKLVERVVDYESRSTRRRRAWLHFDQYRKHLLLKRVHPFIITTDVTNYFDSILHGRLAECFHGILVPPRMIGLLSLLLERLSLRDAYSDFPHIGLPVDEFDCSRKLAHMMLFPHDERMVQRVSEDAYVRWMDDQTIGAESRADGLRVLAHLGQSLSRLHLTPNAGKTKLMTLAEARRHFHLDINKMLDQAQEMPYATPSERRKLGMTTRAIWKLAAPHDGQGAWDKILKRLYRFAGLANVRLFRRRARWDIVADPTLARRICEYMRCSGSVSEYLDFAEAAWNDDEQIHPDVNLVLVESLLRLEATGEDATRIRRIASAMLAGQWKPPGAALCAEVAPLLLLRHGDRRSLPRLRMAFTRDMDKRPAPVIKAAAIVFASYGDAQYRVVRKAAASLLLNPLAEMVRLIERIRQYDEVPERHSSRMRTNYDPVAGQAYVDMRDVLAARLLALNAQPKVRQWLADKKKELLKQPLSTYDRHLLNRMLP